MSGKQPSLLYLTGFKRKAMKYDNCENRSSLTPSTAAPYDISLIMQNAEAIDRNYEHEVIRSASVIGLCTEAELSLTSPSLPPSPALFLSA